MAKAQRKQAQAPKSKLKKNDEIIVIAGKDKGRRGTVLRVTNKSGRFKILVEGVNLVKKHVRANPEKQQQGGIVEKEALLDASNVAIFNPLTKKADRIGYKTLEDGRKVRYFKSNDEMIDI